MDAVLSGPRAGRAPARPIGFAGAWDALYVAFAAAALLPFLLAPVPPVVDFANHAARLHLACAAAAGDADVAAMYRYRLGLIPNLAVDIVNAPLCGLVDPALLLRLVTAGALGGVFAGCWRLRRATGGAAGPALLFVPALAMNVVTMTGYVNFLVGAAVAVNLMAELARRPRGPLATVVLGNGAGIALFFAHVFALATAAALAFGWQLNGRRPDARGLARAGLATGAMFALPLAALPFVAREGGGFVFAPATKLRALFAPFLTYDFGLDLLCLTATVPALYVAWRRGALSPAAPMRRPLAMLAAYVLLVPSEMSTAVDIDARSAVVLAWLFLASLEEARPAGWLGVAAAVPLALHGAQAARWPDFARQAEEVRRAFAVLPARSRLVSLEAPGGRSAAPRVAYTHLASYATLDRHVFNPLEFTGAGMQPLSSVGPYRAIDVGAAMPMPLDAAALLARPSPETVRRAGQAAFALRWPERFDYALLYDFAPGRPARLPYRQVAQGSFFRIYALPGAGR